MPLLNRQIQLICSFSNSPCSLPYKKRQQTTRKHLTNKVLKQWQKKC